MKFLGLLLTRITILLKVAWLLLPAIAFLVLTYLCFWMLSQGQDVLIATMENLRGGRIGWIVLVALLFWVIVTWYSSRVLVYRKPALYESKTIGFHAPRLFGFMGFSLLWVAILRLKIPETESLPVLKDPGKSWIPLLASAGGYVLLYYLFKRIRDKSLMPVMHRKLHREKVSINALAAANAAQDDQPVSAEEKKEQRLFRLIYIGIAIAVILILILNFILSSPLVFFWSIISLQVIFLFMVVIRRGRLPYGNLPLDGTIEDWMALWRKKKQSFEPVWLGRILYHTNVSLKERVFFYVFNAFAVIALFFYFKAIVDLEYAISIGTLSLVLLAFGVLVGFFALISVLSIIKKINFHFVLLVVVILMSKTREPHYVRQADATSPQFQHSVDRPDLKTYFRKWVEARKAVINNSNEYPVFFVLSDGGASRSGYWVAGALGKLQDVSRGKFSEHLFCLSGASGGVVGQGTFFALLNEKSQMQNRSYEREAKTYLRNDFLSFTLARMLGPDFFRPLIPIVRLENVKDRAGALETALEAGVPDSVFLKNKLALPFSSFVTRDSMLLPIFCINTTRMQDGRPGVVSNINIHNLAERDSAFGPRLDVLDFMARGKDLRLSTALILGSRFPYISPAGRIDERIPKRNSKNGQADSLRSHYFVDGGYFDNSGAGIVHEMLLELEEMRKAMVEDINADHKYLQKLRFYVIHITNGPIGNPPVNEVNFLNNDLFAPVLTMIGAYGTQTTVNDWRLRKHLQLLYRTRSDTVYYKRIDLYKGINPEKLNFPMNWTISNYYRNRMDSLLAISRQANSLGNWMRDSLR